MSPTTPTTKQTETMPSRVARATNKTETGVAKSLHSVEKGKCDQLTSFPAPCFQDKEYNMSASTLLPPPQLSEENTNMPPHEESSKKSWTKVVTDILSSPVCECRRLLSSPTSPTTSNSSESLISSSPSSSEPVEVLSSSSSSSPTPRVESGSDCNCSLPPSPYLASLAAPIQQLSHVSVSGSISQPEIQDYEKVAKRARSSSNASSSSTSTSTSASGKGKGHQVGQENNTDDDDGEGDCIIPVCTDYSRHFVRESALAHADSMPDVLPIDMIKMLKKSKSKIDGKMAAGNDAN